MLRTNAKHVNMEKLHEVVLYEEKKKVCKQNLTPLKTMIEEMV